MNLILSVFLRNERSIRGMGWTEAATDKVKHNARGPPSVQHRLRDKKYNVSRSVWVTMSTSYLATLLTIPVFIKQSSSQ